MTVPHKPFLDDILVLEQTAIVGSIIQSTARELKLPRVRLATNLRAAQQLLERQAFSGLILSLNDQAPTLALVENIRTGKYRTQANVPMAVTTTECGVELAQTLRAYLVRRILLKPFKVRDVILTIRMLEGGYQDDQGQAAT